MHRPSLPGQQGLYRPQPGPLRVGATFVLILALLAGAGFGAQRTLLTLWDRVVGYDSPYLQQLAMPGAGGLGPLTPAVVMVVIDGLRIDATSMMPTLQALMASGTVAAARTELPSLSLPGAAALGTGAPPFVHGVTTNWYEAPIGTDSIFAAVRRAGLTATFIGWDGWEQLYGKDMSRALIPDADKDARGEHDRAVREFALGHLSAGPLSGLTVVYFSETDDTAHEHGGSSQEYLTYVAQVDSYLAEIVGALDLGQVTLLVTADHGHVDAGGHGGGEPEVIWVPVVAAGRGIHFVSSKADGAGGYRGASPVPAPGDNWFTISQLDIAPTIAALLGAPVPTHSLGKYVSQWLGAADASWHATRMIATAAGRSNLSTLLTGLGRGEGEPAALVEARNKLAAGDAPGAIEAAKAFMTAEAAERANLAASKDASRRAARLPWAIAAAVAPLLLLLVLARPSRPWAPVLAAGLYLLLFYLIYTKVHGLSFSFSAFNEEAQIKRFLLLRLLEGGGLMLVAAVLAGFLSRDSDRGAKVTGGLGAVWASALVVYALLLSVVWFYYRQGFVYSDALPDMGASFRCLVLLLTAAGAGYAAVPSVLVTLGLTGVGLRRQRVSSFAGRYR